MRIERRPNATRPAIVAGVLTFISVAWKVVGFWSNVDFLTEKSGLLVKVAHAVFFTSTGTNILIILSVGILIFTFLFQSKSISSPIDYRHSDEVAPAKPRLRIDYMQPRIIDVSLDEESGEIQGPEDDLEPVKAILAEFRRLPDDAEIGFIDVRASIQLWPQNRNRILVNDAYWFGRCHGSEYCAFEIGDSAPLIVAVFGNDVGITYEGRYVNNHFLPDPHQLNEDSYDVDIELIGTKENKVLVHQIFELVLTLRPELALAIRGLHAEVRMVAQGAAIKPPDETAAKVADKPEPPPQSIEDKPQSS